jgi:hypothetical protein
LVEHHLAKVDVESSNLFARSIFAKTIAAGTRRLFCWPEAAGLKEGKALSYASISIEHALV